MDISKVQKDELNAVLKVAITKSDYEEKVNSILKDYRKQANIPGFRKGQVPIGLIKKQYGKAVLVDEVNKLLQDGLSNYIHEEKLDVLGHPLPLQNEEFDWNREDFDFEFELGLAPDFEVNLKSKKAVTHYNIIADQKMIDEQLGQIRKQHGTTTTVDKIEKDSEVLIKFEEESTPIDNESWVELDQLKNNKAAKAFLSQAVGFETSINTKGLFEDTAALARTLGVTYEVADKLDVAVNCSVKEIQNRELAAIDRELLDELYGKDNVADENALKDRIKADFESQFRNQADQKLMGDVTEKLIEETEFDLPSDFLKKWLKANKENPVTDEEVNEEYEKSVKAMRYQLIENKLVEKYELRIQQEELDDYSKNALQRQLQQYGQTAFDTERLEDLSIRMMERPDYAKRMTEELMAVKMLDLFKKEANLKVKELTYDNFIKEVYG